MHNVKRAIPAWSWSFATNLVNLCFGICTGVLVARLLGPAARGELAEVQYWAGAVAAFGICSLPSALSHFVARRNFGSSLPASALAVSIALSIISVVAGLFVLMFFSDPGLQLIAALYLAAFVPANFLALTLSAIDHGNQNFVRYNIFRLLPQSLYLSGILLLWLQGWLSVATLLAVLWFGTLAVCLARICLFRRSVCVWPRFNEAASLWRTGISFHATAFAGILFQNADRMICLLYFSHADLGRYAVATTIAGAGLGVVSSATSIVLFPKLSASKDLQTHRHLIRNALGSSVVIAVAINTTAAALMPFALPLLFGSAFADAIPVAVILCFSQVPMSFVQIATVALRGLDDWRAGPYAQAAATVVFLPAAYTLVPSHGLSGLALALMFSQISASLLLLSRLRTRVGMGVTAFLLPDPRWVSSLLSEYRAATCR